MNIDELVEQFARMTIEERNLFADMLTKKWPHLADSISNLISVYSMANEHAES